VTGKPGPTEADTRLIAELADRGLHATPAQFKRWRAAGLLDPPERPGGGRGKGRPSLCYPSAAVDQAAAIRSLLDRRVPLDEMAMAMFLEDAPVSEAAVRKALQSILADPKAEGLDEEARVYLADQRIDHLLRRSRRVSLLQAWSRMTHKAGNRGALADIVTALILALQEDTFPSDEVIDETAKILGPTEAVTLFYDYLMELGPDPLREAIDTVSLQELRAAQSYLERLPDGILPPEARQNYRFFSIAVLAFAKLLPTGKIETDPTALHNIASLMAES
jgi:DNA-binding transcriptional MerR regulator